MKQIFDWPCGLPIERAQHDKLPGAWIAATGYAQRYDATGQWAIHTGLDLNLNYPNYDSDAHSPVYAPADGTVKFAAHLPVWGMVITIAHDNGIWTRLAHGEACQVQPSQFVIRGAQLCRVGNADGRYPYHLHYDVSRLDLGARPGDWPGDDLPRVTRDYIDPLSFMRAQMQTDPDPSGPPAFIKRVMQVSAVPTVRVRSGPSLQAAIITRLDYQERVEVVEESQDKQWYRVDLPVAGWVSAQWLVEVGS